jgi:hypothetical protein
MLGRCAEIDHYAVTVRELRGKLFVPRVRHKPAIRTWEFNFVKTRAEHGTKEAFRLRDEHFDVPEAPKISAP